MCAGCGPRRGGLAPVPARLPRAVSCSGVPEGRRQPGRADDTNFPYRPIDICFLVLSIVNPIPSAVAVQRQGGCWRQRSPSCGAPHAAVVGAGRGQSAWMSSTRRGAPCLVRVCTPFPPRRSSGCRAAQMDQPYAPETLVQGRIVRTTWCRVRLRSKLWEAIHWTPFEIELGRDPAPAIQSARSGWMPSGGAGLHLAIDASAGCVALHGPGPTGAKAPSLVSPQIW